MTYAFILVAVFALLAVHMTVASTSVKAHYSTQYWLHEIMMCESGGDPLAENLNETETHWDGRIGSFGLFQFGEGTWQDVASRMWENGVLDIDWSHTPPHYAPEEVQRRMAWLTWDYGKGWAHWYNCAHHVGYVDWIGDELYV